MKGEDATGKEKESKRRGRGVLGKEGEENRGFSSSFQRNGKIAGEHCVFRKDKKKSRERLRRGFKCS